jgi:tetratricopeptide (TPR) repeat protein
LPVSCVGQLCRSAGGSVPNAAIGYELEAVRREVGEPRSICYYFGRLDLEEQNYKSAVANLNNAIAKPPFPDATYFLGLAYLKEGSDQDAEKWLKEAAKRNPEDSRAEYQLALLYKKEGREEEGQQAFSRTKEQRDQSDKFEPTEVELRSRTGSRRERASDHRLGTA